MNTRQCRGRPMCLPWATTQGCPYAFLMTVTLCLFLAGQVCAEFRAAIAVRDVTPDPLLPVSGGVGPTSPANKKFGRLTVRALT
ncbi:MAG: hypothetical protein ACYSWW_24775, partial [Planctomycetota bacterium]